MSIQVQHRRGSAAAHASFVGAPGEITSTTDSKRLVLHDGATVGGIAMARLDEVSGEVLRAVGNANFNFQITDRLVASNTAFTAPRTGTLPLASAVAPGRTITFFDTLPAINGANTLTIARAGSDTINGATSLVCSTPGGRWDLVSDGDSRWSATFFIVDGDRGDVIVSGSGAAIKIKPKDGLLSSVSSAYTVVASDARKLLSLSGTFTLSTTAAATLGAGFLIYLINEGAGVVTVDPAGSETIDGEATLTLLSRQSCTLLCDGSNWRTLGYDQSPVIAVRRITSPVASVDIPLPAGYSKFEIQIANLTMATVGTSLNYRISDNGGASFRAGNNDYTSFINFTTFAGGNPAGGVLNATYAELAGAVDSGAGAYRLHTSGMFYPGGAGDQPSMLHHVTARNTTPAITLASYTTYYPGTTSGGIGRVNAIRFLANSGNINTGTFVIRGVP